MRSGGRTCSAPTSSTSSRCSSPCRRCSSPPWRRTCCTAPSCSGCSTPSGRGRAPRLAHLGVDHPGPPPRPGGRAGGEGVGRGGGAGRLTLNHVAGAARVRPRRGVRRAQRHLPRRHLAPDHPRLDARPAGRHRDAVLLGGPPRRRDALGARGRPLRRAAGGHAAAGCCASSASRRPRCGCAASGPTTSAPTRTPCTSGGRAPDAHLSASQSAVSPRPVAAAPSAVPRAAHSRSSASHFSVRSWADCSACAPRPRSRRGP